MEATTEGEADVQRSRGFHSIGSPLCSRGPHALGEEGYLTDLFFHMSTLKKLTCSQDGGSPVLPASTRSQDGASPVLPMSTRSQDGGSKDTMNIKKLQGRG